MPTGRYDIVTIGGGLAGAAIAHAMARNGARVLVLERDTKFHDRVRGEALLPWGVAEAKALGIYDHLLETCGREQRWMDIYMGTDLVMHRDLSTTTPQQAGICSFFHPRMQESLISAAAQAGAEVRRGVIVSEIRPGEQPTVIFNHDGAAHEVSARLVAAADGRVSQARKLGGFTVERDLPTLMLAGVLLRDTGVPQDVSYIMTNPVTYQAVFLFPQRDGLVRSYYAYPVTSPYRLQGEADFPVYLTRVLEAGAPESYYAGAKVSGPLASFEVADSWVPHPYRQGIALLGDAAASSDPSWGNGLSLSLRSVRILRDRLLANNDWDKAGHEYAEEHHRVYDIVHNVTTWSRQIFMESGAEADARRAKVMPALASDPDYFPDHGISGPDLPFDRELYQARLFGL